MFQVCHPADVWLLPFLGTGVGLQEKGHHGGNKKIRRRHHHATGGGILYFYQCRAEVQTNANHAFIYSIVEHFGTVRPSFILSHRASLIAIFSHGI